MTNRQKFYIGLLCFALGGSGLTSEHAGGGWDFSSWTQAAKLDRGWIILVDKALDRSASFGQVCGDLEFWDSLKDGDANLWAVIDSDNEAAKLYASAIADAGGLPTLIVADRDKTKGIVASVKLTPEMQTREGIRSIVAQYIKVKK